MPYPSVVTLFLLIRHALTDATGKRLSGWTPGIHLSARGREQAAGLAERLADIPIAAIYSSPLERCRETASPIATNHGLKVQRSRHLGEVRYGDWTNRPMKQLMRTKLWRTVQQNPAAARFPGGESLLECQNRIVSETGRIAAAHASRVVAIVSHGDTIRLLLAHFSGVHTDNFQRISVSPASVSAVAVGEGMPRILKINDTGTLADIAGKMRG